MYGQTIYARHRKPDVSHEIFSSQVRLHIGAITVLDAMSV